MPYKDDLRATITIKGDSGYERTFENVSEFVLSFRTTGTTNVGAESRGDLDVVSFLMDFGKHMIVNQRFIEIAMAQKMGQVGKGLVVPKLQLIRKDGKVS